MPSSWPCCRTRRTPMRRSCWPSIARQPYKSPATAPGRYSPSWLIRPSIANLATNVVDGRFLLGGRDAQGLQRVHPARQCRRPGRRRGHRGRVRRDREQAVADLITPLIAAVGGKPDFSQLSFTINKSKFLYGDFINAVISFVIIAAAIYFLV